MLDTATAETTVLALLDELATRTDNPAQARRDVARRLVGVMATLIRSGTVTGNVTTTGSATTQSGPLLGGRIS